MAIEIERKYLVASLPPDLEKYPNARILQGYLGIAADSSEARVRCHGENCTLTVKQGVGRTRREDEIFITQALFDSLWPLSETRRIEKIRYQLPLERQTLEVDRYLGDLSGLVVVEVEFENEIEADAWQPPPWVGSEVTNDPSYKNQQLALHGFPHLASGAFAAVAKPPHR